MRRQRQLDSSRLLAMVAQGGAGRRAKSAAIGGELRRDRSAGAMVGSPFRSPSTVLAIECGVVVGGGASLAASRWLQQAAARAMAAGGWSGRSCAAFVLAALRIPTYSTWAVVRKTEPWYTFSLGNPDAFLAPTIHRFSFGFGIPTLKCTEVVVSKN